MDRKGYYKVIGKDDGLYITYSPKEDNGKDVSLEEYMSYLEKKVIDYGTVAELNAAMNEAREIRTARLRFQELTSFLIPAGAIIRIPPI